MKQATSLIFLIFLLTLLAGGVIACVPQQTSEQQQADNCMDYDPLFRQYCIDAGKHVVGNAISGVVDIGGKECMYSTNFLLCYERNLELPQVVLQPLSNHLFLGPEVVVNPSCGLDPIFQPLDDLLLSKKMNLGGLVGCAIYDYENGKITQFRENVGYTVRMYDSQAQPEILPVGQMVCDQNGSCPKGFSITAPKPPVAYKCRERFERLNFGDLTGLPVFMQDDFAGCDHQVVFGGIAFCMSDDCGTFYALPLGQQFGQTSPMVPKNEQLLNHMRFIEFQNGLGYHIYHRVDQFISQHGGYEISGLPISEPFLLSENVVRQCFTNYCLDYNISLPKSQDIKLVSLGDAYASRDLPPDLLMRPVYSEYNVHILVNEQQSFVSAGERPVISLQVFNAQNAPIANLGFNVTLTNSDGMVIKQYSMAPTDQEGKSWMSLDPVNGKKGDVIAYRVCADLVNSEGICVTDTFVIWP